jgi:LysM repeat protein
MNAPRLIAIALGAATLASCSAFKKDENYDTAGGYDTSDPYGVPSADGYESAPYQDVNPPASDPTYGSAAYEEAAPTPPPAPAPASPAPAAGARSHTVVKGDTLWGISRKYGVTVDGIRAANSMAANDTNVRLGQTLSIPAQ